MESNQRPTFEAVEKSLEMLEALGTAADAHGLLSALFCTGAVVRKHAWVNSLLTSPVQRENTQAINAQKTLEAMYVVTADDFQADDFQMQLLLPDDEAELELRINALSQWCQGFITGLKLTGLDVEHPKNAEWVEPLSDLIKIACMEYQGEQTGDPEAEASYAELVEYVRMAVLSLHNDADRERIAKSGTQAHQGKLH